MSSIEAVALVPAAGEGRRFGGRVHKAFARLDGRFLIWRTLDRLAACPAVRSLVVALHADDLADWTTLPGLDEARESWGLPLHVVAGGRTRAHSVGCALREAERLELPGEFACIHDAARPWVAPESVGRVIAAAAATGAAALVRPVTDTVKEIDDDGSLRTLDRDRLRSLQTPQVIRRDMLSRAYSEWEQSGEPPVTDDLQLLEESGAPVTLVEGPPENRKVTFQHDMDDGSQST